MSRTNIILFGVVLTLGAFIAFFERGTLSTSERDGRKGQVLDSFVRDKVQRIELQRKGITTVLVRRAADPNDQFDVPGWSVEQPYKARADHVVVDNLLGALEYFEPRRTLGPLSDAERARFGLTKPRFRVAFTVGRDRVSFRVGSPAADGGTYLEL
ncbi:MAG TPA: DUF4340 domain-containing protein, partial [Polyangiales bacterium]|nr:DUF4340 domain-containing protein [Polyangiales bacterium]